jgi:hypothetical protein
MIQEMADAGRTRDEIRAEVMRAFGVGEDEAEFMIAIALGEIDGDVLVVDEQGQEIRDPRA